MHNKKAAIGAAMTWVVATIIILLVIIVFVYASWVLSVGRSKGGSMASVTDSTKEQMLLALLETEIDGKNVKEHIESDEVDWKKLEQKIKPIIEKFPKLLPLKGDWVFIVYEGNKNKLQIGKSNNLVGDSSPSIVYVKGKKVKLSFDYLEQFS